MFIDAVADSFILRGRKPTGEPLTQLDLNKMAFYAHGWSLALRGEPLTTEPFIAYKDGPVLVQFRRRFSRFGADEIKKTAVITKPSQILADWVENLLDEIWRIYGRINTGELVGMTHRINTPWRIVRGDLPLGEPSDIQISDDLIAHYFNDLLKSECAAVPFLGSQSEVVRDFLACNVVYA
jgi:uncharacterized phage-associated protein